MYLNDGGHRRAADLAGHGRSLLREWERLLCRILRRGVAVRGRSTERRRGIVASGDAPDMDVVVRGVLRVRLCHLVVRARSLRRHGSKSKWGSRQRPCWPFFRVANPGRSSTVRKRRLRLKHGLPRGGLGQAGWLPSLGSFAAAYFLRADVASFVGLLAIPICVWCAVGLRADEAAGEGSDHYVNDESLDCMELLSRNFEHPVRRHSTVLIALCLLACVIA